jgi:hypothetical protein
MQINQASGSNLGNNIELSSLYLLITEVEQTVTAQTSLSNIHGEYESVPAQVFIL